MEKGALKGGIYSRHMLGVGGVTRHRQCMTLFRPGKLLG